MGALWPVMGKPCWPLLQFHTKASPSSDTLTAWRPKGRALICRRGPGT